MKWKNYTSNRLIAEHPCGFYIIKPAAENDAQPLFCPVCEVIMRSIMDDDAYKKFTCCDSCSIIWAYSNRDKWKNGWRPTSDEVMNKYKVYHT